MPDDKDNIEKIPIRFKHKEKGEKMLTLVPSYKGCLYHSYVIDAEASQVTCKNCDKIFNPMAVLVELARKESRWMMNLEDYEDRMKRLSEKKRVKCKHCKQFTPVREK